jgi:polyisoprenoid-binding protein YceI
MKKQIFFSLLAIAFASLAFVKPSGMFYNVDTANSSIQWKGYKVTGEHYGVVNLKSGALTVDDNGNFNGGSFIVDMNTITVLDLTGKGKESLEGHLKSADFFGIENFPTAKFVITKVIPKGKPGEYKVIGNMTIKNSTEELRFDARVTEEAGKMTATADVRLDRSQYDIRFGSGSFFDNLGDKTIYDEFDLSIKLTAKK